jgi:hypothetical protein
VTSSGAGGKRLSHPRGAIYDANGVWIENTWGTSWGLYGWAELSWSFINQYAWEAANIVS